MVVQTRSTRVKAPAKPEFQVEIKQISNLSNDVKTLTPQGRVNTDIILQKKSPKFLNTRSEMCITTFNARTLAKEFYMTELLNSIEHHKLSLVSVQEHRLRHEELVKFHKLSAEYTFVTSSATTNNSNASVGGIGTVLNRDSMNCLLSAESVSSRILVLSFSGNPRTTHICCYSPHNQSSEEEVENFYEELSEVVQQIPAHNVVFICGDFNAQLGSDRVHHSYHQQSNRNGEYLFDFMERFGLVASNTLFQKPSRKLWTCHYPNGSKGQVDYILVRRKWVKSVTNVETYTTTFHTLQSDHKGVTAKVKLRLRAPKIKPSDFRSINFRSLNKSKELQNLYSVEVQNQFSALMNDLPDDTSVQEKYDCLTKACSEAGKQSLPKRDSKKWSNLHKSPEVNEARQKLKKAIDSGLAEAIANAKNDLISSYKTAEECFIETQIHIIEHSSFSQQHATAWKVLNEVTGRNADTPPAKLKGSPDDRKRQWKEYFSSLLGQPPSVPDTEFIISPVVDHILPIEQGPFTLEELSKALKYTKRGGAVGVDCIPLEIWENPLFSDYLLEVCNIALSDHIKPKQWSQSAIKPIPKKSNVSLLKDHRGISLNTIAAKLYNKMLLNRIQPHIDPILSWSQCGFRKSRSTLSNILALRRIIEGLKDKNLPLAIVFIDFSKAFDSIHRERMFKILEAYGIPPSIVNAIKLIYEDSSAQVLTPDGETSFFDIVAGIFQGDTLAPFLFIIVLDYALREAFNITNSECRVVIEPRRGYRQPEIRIRDLAYADDIALLNKSIKLAENLLHSVEQSASQLGLHLNASKTEVLTSCINDPYEIKSLSGETLKHVKNFKYLGAHVPSSAYDHNIRKGLAWTAVNKLERIWKSNLSKSLKIKFFRACVESILLYNSETWTLTKALEIRVNGLYTKLLRRALNVSWKDHVSNNDLYGDLPLLSATIKQRRLRFAGHCFRAEDQPINKLLFWSPSQGKRGRGAGIKTYSKLLKEDTGLASEKEIQDLMKNRRLWRQRVDNIIVSSKDD